VTQNAPILGGIFSDTFAKIWRPFAQNIWSCDQIGRFFSFWASFESH